MRDLRWKYTLLVLCALALVMTTIVAADELGFGRRPWFGWWDANITIAQPFLLTIQPNPDGAAARSGLRDGDRIDVRRQTLAARIATTYQLMATQPTVLVVDRGGSARTIAVTGGSLWEHATFVKLYSMLSRAAAGLILTVCALIVSLRLWYLPQARRIVYVMICALGVFADPSFLVVPWAALSLVLLLLSRTCAALAALLLIGTWRSLAAGIVAVAFAADLSAIVGLATVRIDPLPFILSLSTWRSLLDVAVWLAVAIVCMRRRATVMLPMSIAFLVSAVCFASPAFVHVWLANMIAIVIANVAVPLGAIVATNRGIRVKSRTTGQRLRSGSSVLDAPRSGSWLP